ncbi:hypothetical protein ACQZV8_17930 [Magnetococcales bacterium HHB-1]
MLHTLAITSAFGVTNTMQEQINLANTASQMRTNNAEQLEEKSVKEVRAALNNETKDEPELEIYQRFIPRQPSPQENMHQETQAEVEKMRQQANQTLLGIATYTSSTTLEASKTTPQEYLDISV